jgi:hypothetical protein
MAAVMNSSAFTFGLLRLLRAALGTIRYCLKPVAVWLVLALFCGTVTARVGAQNPSASSLGPGMPFAIADFDGDLLPDLIRVQSGSNSSGSTNYWIQLQLSAAGNQSIRLVAPAGGLVIAARDVNGDHTIDLVLATVWSRRPVAIFLNDGRGNFSRVEPTAFSDVFRESTTSLSSGLFLTTDAVGVPTQARSNACQERYVRDDVSLQSDAVSRSRIGFFFNSFLVSNAGRAPPFEFPHQ